MTRGGKAARARRERRRQEDPSLDALVATIPDSKPVAPVEEIHRPFRGWKDDQENWVKDTGMWGR